MAKSVKDAMTANPRTISGGTPVVDAARVMRDENVGALPLVEGGRLVGTLTDRDIVVRVIADGRDPHSVSAGEIASRDLVTVDPQQNLDDALRLMAQHQVRRIPVVEEDGRLVGVVAQADVAQEAKSKRVGEAVEEISR
jgi:CBS domain-containing protein